LSGWVRDQAPLIRADQIGSMRQLTPRDETQLTALGIPRPPQPRKP
jgi:hypothetical protein